MLNDCHSPYIVDYYGAFHNEGDINICMTYMASALIHMLFVVYLFEACFSSHGDLQCFDTVGSVTGRAFTGYPV